MNLSEAGRASFWQHWHWVCCAASHIINKYDNKWRVVFKIKEHANLKLEPTFVSDNVNEVTSLWWHGGMGHGCGVWHGLSQFVVRVNITTQYACPYHEQYRACTILVHSVASADPLTLQLSYKLLLSKSVTQRLEEAIHSILVHPCSVKIIRNSLIKSQKE